MESLYKKRDRYSQVVWFTKCAVAKSCMVHVLSIIKILTCVCVFVCVCLCVCVCVGGGGGGGGDGSGMFVGQ